MKTGWKRKPRDSRGNLLKSSKSRKEDLKKERSGEEQAKTTDTQTVTMTGA